MVPITFRFFRPQNPVPVRGHHVIFIVFPLIDVENTKQVGPGLGLGPRPPLSFFENQRNTYGQTMKIDRMAAVRINPVPVRTGSGSQTVRFNPVRRNTNFKNKKKYEKYEKMKNP